MTNTSDVIFDTLAAWGVDTIFGLPGDGINGLMEALRTRQDEFRFVLSSHEEAAAFAAVGYAKFTGKPGVVLATSGPGGIHLLNGLYDAKMDGQPVIAITGHTYSDLIGSHYQQEVDLVQLFSDVANYNVQVNSAEHARLATDLAVRTAIGTRGVAHINIPTDIQTWKHKGSYSHMKVPEATAAATVSTETRPPRAAIERAAEVLNEGKKIVIFAGSGARGAHNELLSLAKRLQAPIIKALLGKDIVPDVGPYVLGGSGLLGTRPSERAVEDCDTLLLVGTSFPYYEFLPKPGDVQAIQIDIAPERMGLRHPIDVGLVGDAKAALEELLPLVQPRADSTWLEELQHDMEDWRDVLNDRAMRDGAPMKPQRSAHELNRLLDDDAIITCDSGTIATWAARYIDIRGTQRFSLSGNLATMASAIPYAIGAQIAHPERQVVAYIGDGGCMMLGSELSTLAYHDLPVKVVVVNNHSLGMIRWEQMAFLGNPSYGTELPHVDFVRFAESQGVRAWSTDDPEDVGSVLEDALRHDGPALVECMVDTDEPPMPPSTEFGQAAKMGKALARGEPHPARISMTLLRDKARDLNAKIRR